MRVVIRAQARGGVLFRWRTERGLSVAAACRELELPKHLWYSAESLRFDRCSTWAALGRLATAIGCLPEEICPPELFRQNAALTRCAELEVPPDRLLPIGRAALMLPAPSEEDVADKLELADRVEALLKTLTERERVVVKLRYGIGDQGAHTLEDVGKMVGLSRERVRQIEAKAICKLRHPMRARKPGKFLEPKG